MEITIISRFRGRTQWVQRGLYCYTAFRHRSGSVYYRCGSTGCRVRWASKPGIPGPVKGQHEHDPQPWIPERNQMFCRIKERCISEMTSLKTIYEEEALRYQRAAPHLTYKSVLASMRNWRRSSTRTADAVPSTS